MPVTSPIGFSTSCLYKSLDTCSIEAINLLAGQSLEAIEIMCAHAEDVDRLTTLISHLTQFKVKSLHLPVDIRYENIRDVRLLLGKLSEFYQAIGASLAVVHPDLVDSWLVFKGRPMRFALENMDSCKKRFQYPDEFEDFFIDHPDWQLLLDLNHAYSNGLTTALALVFIKEFHQLIAEVHLSGYKDAYHFPLFETKQKEILSPLGQLSCPIIIESPLKNAHEVARELAYIKSNLS